jgi:hypothetical protein
VAGGVVLIFACCICKFYISHNKNSFILIGTLLGYCRKGMRNASRGSLIKCS